jgi:hypothetical protein
VGVLNGLVLIVVYSFYLGMLKEYYEVFRNKTLIVGLQLLGL